MRESVETYGGFYIGRYETGNWHESTNAYRTTNAVVVRGNNDISATANGTNADAEATWYAYYQKSKNVVQGTNIKSGMIWGCQWDATLKWFISSGSKTIDEIFDSRTWGNYRTSDGNRGPKKATGSSDNYQANQIFDMAGNIYEYTMEARYDHARNGRGGYYDSPDRYSGAFCDASSAPSYANDIYGSRSTLIL